MDWPSALVSSIPHVLAIGVLILGWYIEKKRQSPEAVTNKWIIALYKKRGRKRHKNIKEGKIDEVASDFSDTISELDILLRDKED